MKAFTRLGCIRRAGHRLDAQAASATRRVPDRIAGEEHQIAVAPVLPDGDAHAAGSGQLDASEAVGIALEIGERCVELDPPDRTQAA